MGAKELSAVRWLDYSVVMQNAMNPVKSIGSQHEDVTRVLGHHDPKEVRGHSKEVFALVAVNPVPDLHPLRQVVACGKPSYKSPRR